MVCVPSLFRTTDFKLIPRKAATTCSRENTERFSFEKINRKQKKARTQINRKRREKASAAIVVSRGKKREEKKSYVAI